MPLISFLKKRGAGASPLPLPEGNNSLTECDVNVLHCRICSGKWGLLNFYALSANVINGDLVALPLYGVTADFQIG